MGDILRFKTREEWLAARRNFIGASESAAVCNASLYGTPLTVFNHKVLGKTTVADSIRLKVGRLLEEPVIFPLYNDETGNQCIPFGQSIGAAPGEYVTLQHADLDYMAATPDGCVVNDVAGRGRVNVQAKSAEPWTWPLWEDGVPVYHFIQVQQEMACLPDVQWTDLVTLFGYSALRIDRIERDPEWIDSIMAELRHFREAHWLPKIPPPVTAKDVDKEAVMDWIPRNETVMQLDPRFVALDEERLANAAKMKALQDRNEVIKADVKSELIKAKAKAGMLPDGRKYSYSIVNVAEHVVKANSHGRLNTPRKPKV